jgi:hypothetical protein
MAALFYLAPLAPLRGEGPGEREEENAKCKMRNAKVKMFDA